MTILNICLPTDLPIVVDVFCRHSIRRTSPVGEFFVRSSRSRDNDCLELRIYINMIVCWILHTVVVSCFRTTTLLMEKSSEIASRKTEYNVSMDWGRTFSGASCTCQPSRMWFSRECHKSLTRASRKTSILNIYRTTIWAQLTSFDCFVTLLVYKSSPSFKTSTVLVFWWPVLPHLPLSQFYFQQNVTRSLKKIFGSRVKISKFHVIWL